MKRELWFENLWHDYQNIAPNVSNIRALIEAAGNRVTNDHVAFRTFNIAPIDIASLSPLIRSLGYEPFDTYKFEQKRLDAQSFVHPDGGPRIFLSELRVDEFSSELQSVIHDLVGQVALDDPNDLSLFWRGPLWAPVAHSTYLKLRRESEYAAWVAALGMRPNHFTVAVNELTTFSTLGDLLEAVKAFGFELNASGGEIKGSPKVMLEQGSTLADSVAIAFDDGEYEVPTCYYEFAYRYPGPDGSLFDGFVTGSADKIFESTNSAR